MPLLVGLSQERRFHITRTSAPNAGSVAMEVMVGIPTGARDTAHDRPPQA